MENNVPSFKEVVSEELSLLSRGSGRKEATPIGWDIIRTLNEGDLETLKNPPPSGIPGQTCQQMRHTHHQLAQLLAQGTDETTASVMTGYSPAYISLLKSDPAFKELLANYCEQRDAIFVDTLERMKALGLHTLEEIQSRLAENPENFTNRELMEMAKVLLPAAEGRAAGGVRTQNGGNVGIQISFVTANHEEKPGIVINGE